MKAKINLRGAINALEVGQTIALDRVLYNLSVVSRAASALTVDTGKSFSVNPHENTVFVKHMVRCPKKCEIR